MDRSRAETSVIITVLIILVFCTLFFGDIIAGRDVTMGEITAHMNDHTPQSFCKETTYVPRNITPKNASYHLSEKAFTVEWWYFEGIFDNGYNAVVNVILLSKNNIGFCITHLHLFHEDHTKDSFSTRTIQSFATFKGSDTHPDISVKGKHIITFDQECYNLSKNWVYMVKFGFNTYAVDLKFAGLTPGWEGDTLGGFYGPVLPMADVEGSITINNSRINVTGIGYHEHAHGIDFPIWEWGWYWGKIVGDNMSLFWGKMMNTRWNEQARAGILSIKHAGYIPLDPATISMNLLTYTFQAKRFLPTLFVFNITDSERNIVVNVTMTATQIHYLPLGWFHYWRYLITINGEIMYNGHREVLKDATQIMEVMRFR